MVRTLMTLVAYYATSVITATGIVLNQEEEEPASAETVLKIEKVFCGEEASRIGNLNPALADVVFDSKEHSDENADDDDSDIEKIDMLVA